MKGRIINVVSTFEVVYEFEEIIIRCVECGWEFLRVAPGSTIDLNVVCDRRAHSGCTCEFRTKEVPTA